MAPGGPIEKFLSEINHTKISNEITESKLNNIDVKNLTTNNFNSKYQGSTGVDPDLIKQLEKA